MTRSTTIIEIAHNRPYDAWLQTKLSELDVEMAKINEDRNRLIVELSRARNQIYRLLAGIQDSSSRESAT